MSAGLHLIALALGGEFGPTDFFQVDRDLFRGADAEAYSFVEDFYLKYGKMPEPGTIAHELQMDLPHGTEPPKFYIDKLKERHHYLEMVKVLETCNDMLKEKKATEAVAYALEAVTGLKLKAQKDQIIDFASDGFGLVMEEYKKKLMLGDEYGIQTGWPSFDKMNGGLTSGDVLALVGRPASGKSYLQLAMAVHIWRSQKKVPLFVSMEMNKLAIAQRLTAMFGQKSIRQIKTGTMSSHSLAELKGTMGGMQQEGRPFHIIDANLTSSVRDIEMFAQQLRPDVVIVDGAYMLVSNDKHRREWEAIKDTVYGLKRDVAQGAEVPVVASYQFNREATKKNADIGVDKIAGGDSIGQIASMVLGLLQEETVETLVTKSVRILKGREGERGEFTINWIFDQPPVYMNFSEVSQNITPSGSDIPSSFGYV